MLIALGLTAAASAQTQVFTYTSGTGLSNFGGSLGLFFDVGASNITVTQYGAFDAGGDGLAATISVAMFNRDTMSIVGSTLTFSGSSDILSSGYRLQTLGTPLTLTAGGHYAIVAWGYGASEAYLNNHNGTTIDFNSDGGAITYVNSWFNGTAGQYPNTNDNGASGPVYGAGTFVIGSAIPEPASWAAAIGSVILAGVALRRTRKTARSTEAE